MIDNTFPIQMRSQLAQIITSKENQAYCQAYILSYQRSDGSTLYLHTKENHQNQTHHNIHYILKNRHKHRDTGVLHTDIPSREAIQTQHRRSSPNTDVEIGLRQIGNLGCGMNYPKCSPTKRILQQQNKQGQRQTNSERP